MSIAALKPAIRNIRADGFVTADEVRSLNTPAIMGGVFDNDEFELVRSLASDVRPVDTTPATPEKVDAKLTELNQKHQKRLVDKGVKIGGFVGGGLVTAAFIGALVVGQGAIASFLVAAAPILGLAVGIGALAGFIRSKVSPITTADVESESAKVKAAEDHKKDPHVENGVKVGGSFGGAIAGVFGVAGVVLVAAAAMSTPGGGAAAAAVAAALYTVVIGSPVGLVVASLCGVGALCGFIYSKVKQSQNSDVPTGAIKSDAEAKALLDDMVNKGPTAKDDVKKGTKIGGIVGGVLGGLGVAGFGVSLAASGAAVTSATLLSGGLIFIPVGLAAIGVTALGMGIGALAGYIKSKTTTPVD